MLDELRAKYLSRFVETARGRIQRCLQLIGEPDGAAALAGEFHALAGESAMLGFSEVAEAARAGEVAAVRWRDGDAAAQGGCARVLRGLNRDIAALASQQPERAEARPAPERSEQERRVVIVDDSELASQQLADHLEQLGVAVRSAASEGAALREVEAFTPGLVLADVNIPGVDLAAMCRRIRAARAGVSIVLLSGMSADQLAVRAREVGADGFVSKQDGAGPVARQVVALIDAASGGAGDAEPGS